MKIFLALFLVLIFSINAFSALTLKSQSTTVKVVTPPVVPAPIANLQPGKWLELPNTKLRSVAWKTNDPAFANVTKAWSGGTADTKRNRLIIWGGGHNDYHGNELYALDLSTMSVMRLTPNTGVSACTGNITEPESRHTYSGLAYIAHLDKFFSVGGALTCGGNADPSTWLFDFVTSKWTKAIANSPVASGSYGFTAAYDPFTKLVFVHDTNKLLSYNPDTNTYKTFSNSFISNYSSSAIDTKRKKLVVLKDNAVHILDTTTGQRTTPTTTNFPPLDDAPGTAYDPIADKIVVWSGSDKVWALDLDTYVWSQVNTGPGPVNYTAFYPSGTTYGAYGRWAYFPQYRVFALLNGVDENAWVFRLSN